MRKLILASLVSLVFLAGCGGKTGQKPQQQLPQQTKASVPAEQPPVKEVKPLSKAEVNLIVSKVLKDAYKTKRGTCWITKHPESGDEFCMRLMSVNSLMSPENTETIYIMTVGEVTDFPGPHYLGGLGGMFVVQPEERRYKVLDWKTAVSIPGSMGGQSSGKFVKLGNNLNGWKFSGGGTFQGQTFTSSDTYVFQNGKIQQKK